jgi:hypothetical protein
MQYVQPQYVHQMRYVQPPTYPPLQQQHHPQLLQQVVFVPAMQPVSAMCLLNIQVLGERQWNAASGEAKRGSPWNAASWWATAAAAHRPLEMETASRRQSATTRVWGSIGSAEIFAEGTA